MKDEMKKTIKIFATMMIVMSAVALGAWQMYLSQSISGNVVSNEGETIWFSTDLSDFNLMDTTNNSQSQTVSANITNNNGNLTFVVDITTDITDVADACTDYLNDLTLTYKINGDIVNSGENVTIPSGQSVVEATLDAVLGSCPQSINSTLALI